MADGNENGIDIRTAERPTYVIAGASGGIGSALARRLSKRGAQLALLGRDSNKLLAIAAETEGYAFETDVSDFGKMAEAVEAILRQFGKVDGAACLAGSLLLKPAHSTKEAEWTDVVSSNLTSAFSFLRACVKPMMRTGGSVVLVSSAVTRVGLSNHDALAAAKGGIEGLVKSAAATYARHGVRVNCVAPGLIATDMTKTVTSNQALLEAALDQYAIKRAGTADDVAVVIEWLLGQESSWVTGQSLAIDGGLSSVKLAAPVRAKV